MIPILASVWNGKNRDLPKGHRLALPVECCVPHGVGADDQSCRLSEIVVGRAEGIQGVEEIMVDFLQEADERSIGEVQVNHRVVGSSGMEVGLHLLLL